MRFQGEISLVVGCVARGQEGGGTQFVIPAARGLLLCHRNLGKVKFWERVWGHFGVGLESFWNGLGVVFSLFGGGLGSLCDRCGTVWISFGIVVWNRFGNRVGIILEPCWNRFGISLGSSWNRFGNCVLLLFLCPHGGEGVPPSPDHI